MKKFDLIIIGGGAGAFAVAIRANELKVKTAIINEDDARSRELYLKTGKGKRYLKSRLKRFLFRTG